jgi:tetratricopeptide (TPR) repeat protein
MVHYHKGFCTLAGATITHNAEEFKDAAAEFDKTIEAWPARPRRDKNKPPEPLPAAAYLLPVLARLNAGWDDAGLDRAQAQLAGFAENPVCTSSMISPTFCDQVVRTGRQWLGWIAWRHEHVDEAAQYFAGSAGTGWPEWVAGRKAFLAHRYQEAANLYQQAIDLQKPEPASLTARLAPRPDVTTELADLGGAQLLAGNRAAAIASLDAAVKADPSNARALYLRARGKELGRQMDSALADYNLASRAAFASSKELASGEAHLYRGILFYRRKDYSHAEDEFASALNFEISAGLRADATAWRHLAAVTSGSCAASRQYLERSLSSVSPYFPTDEARHAMAACPHTAPPEMPGNRP